MIAIAAVGAIFLIAAYLYKPELLLILFFTLTISSNNFILPGADLNFRPLLGLVVVFWSFTGKRKLKAPAFLSIVSNQLIVCFFSI